MKLLPALVLAVLAGCLAGPDSGPVEVSDSFGLGPGAFHEVNLRLPAGGDVNWNWSADGGREVDFNVHRHDESGVHYEVRGRWASHAGAYHSDEEQGVSLMWTAQAHVQVAYGLWGNFTVGGGAG